MFLPLGDTPNPRNYTPWVTWGLIAVNIAVYLFVTMPLGSNPLAFERFMLEHGYKPGAPQLEDLFSSMFLHGGLLHLAGNMLFLWIFGDNVEHRLGRLKYLLVYLGTGAIATWSFALLAGDSMIPLVGASGAISGILGLYFRQFPRNKVKTFVFFFPFIFEVMYIPVRWVLGFYVVVDNLLPFVLGAQTGVAHGAHIGGFVGGLVLASLFERSRWSPQQEKGKTGTGDSPADSPFVREEIARSIRSGDRGATLRALPGLPQEQVVRLGTAECITLAVWLEEAGNVAAAVSLLRKCIARRPGESELSALYVGLGRLRLRQGQPAAAYQHFLAALDGNPSTVVRQAAMEGLATIETTAGRGRPRI